MFDDETENDFQEQVGNIDIIDINPYEKTRDQIERENFVAKRVFEIFQRSEDHEKSKGAALELEISDQTRLLLSEMGHRVGARTIDYMIRHFTEDEMVPEIEKKYLCPWRGLDGNLEKTFEQDVSNIENLMRKVEFLAAQLVAQEFPELESINQDDIVRIDRIIIEGMSKFVQTYHVDIPLYDKLYEELDVMRVDRNAMVEMYLGRDGVYAYEGRRAIDIARRRVMDPGERKKLRETGELIEIHPQYLVYPRKFKDELRDADKKLYLQQHGVNPEIDEVFIDTGFVGTIPVDIMTVMGFPKDEIDNRIKLLSSDIEERRVKDIPADSHTRNLIVNDIEHNYKLENSAEGLYYDANKNIVRHFAKLTTPEEQFYYLMVREAIVRHYWVQEISSLE